MLLTPSDYTPLIVALSDNAPTLVGVLMALAAPKYVLKLIKKQIKY